MKPLLGLALLAMLAAPTFAADAMKAAAKPEVGITACETGFFDAWNRHDVDAMSSFWADDATLINPLGRVAHGKAEIQKLLMDEQTTVFKASTVNVTNFHVARSLGAGTAFCDGDMTVDGALGADGSALPQMKMHLAVLVQRKGDHWVLAEARPYAFTAPPPAPPAGN